MAQRDPLIRETIKNAADMGKKAGTLRVIDFAVAANMSQANASRLLNGHQDPSPETIPVLEKFLGIDLLASAEPVVRTVLMRMNAENDRKSAEIERLWSAIAELQRTCPGWAR